MLKGNPPLYRTLILVVMQGHQKQSKKNRINLGTAQFCYVGSRVGWVSVLQARALTINLRGENKTTITFMVFAEVLTGRG